MDDPWGSPWTGDNVEAASHRASYHAKPELEPFRLQSSLPALPDNGNGNTSVNTSAPLHASTTIRSPWADDGDGGFEDWKSAKTAAADALQSAPIWAGWANTDAATAQGPSVHSTNDSRTHTGTAAAGWPGPSAPTPSSDASNDTVFAHLSLDPWASEPSAAELRASPPTPGLFVGQRACTPVPHSSLNTTAAVGDQVHHQHEQSEVHPKHEQSEQAPHRQPGQDVNPENSSLRDSGAEVVWSPSEESPAAAAPAPRRGEVPRADNRASLEAERRSSHSRSTSNFADDSDRDFPRQDSPITSIDEESKSRPQQPPSRKASTKVQELVNKFDNLAQAAVEEPISVEEPVFVWPEPSITLRPDGGAEDDSPDGPDEADFGDFEDAQDAASAIPLPRGPPPEPEPERKSTPQSHPTSPAHADPDHQPVATAPLSPAAAVLTPGPGAEDRQAVPRSGPPEFTVDLGKLGDLFDDVPPDPGGRRDVAGLEELERPIHDSFTDISERKVWYRISRQGSSRKHNIGDDDKYRRVAWPTSTTRKETTEIVRRWMEEGSIAGGTTLRSGTGKRSLFGWDSTAEPVSLDKVFGKSSHKAHSRAVSVQQPRHAFALPSPLETTTAPGQQSAAASPSITSFGWSTTKDVDESIKSVSTAPPGNMQPPGPFATRELQPSLPTLGKAGVPLTLSTQQLDKQKPSRDDEDDDEWGEMVSSPPATANPIISDGFSGLSYASIKPLSTVRRPARPLSMPIMPQGRIYPAASTTSPLAAGTTKEKGGTSSADGWASVDFSFFDKLSDSTKPMVVAAANPPTTPLMPVSISSPLEPRRTAASSQATVPGNLQRGEATREEATREEDDLVGAIVEKLPDFSYMLR